VRFGPVIGAISDWKLWRRSGKIYEADFSGFFRAGHIPYRSALKLNSDGDLLRQYARNGSEEAFAELVARHADWVYSAAARMLGDSHAAEDVTQTVFLLLWRQPNKAAGKSLSGWLFQVMRYCVANAQRAENRRRKHETEAAKMVSEILEPDVDRLWDHLAPRLENLMGRLRLRHREVLLLRFYQGKSIAQIGDALNITEEAARKRVSTALDELRRLFGFGGEAVPAVAIGTLMLARATHAAPLPLVAAIRATGTAAPASVAGLADAVRRMILLAKIKFTAIILFFTAVLPVATVASLSLAFQKPPQPMALPQPVAVPPSLPVLLAPSQANNDVSFQTGYSKFLAGDRLTITSIRGTAAAMAPGNSYTVKGTYVLSSEAQATVAVYTGAMNPGENDNGPYGNNQINVQAGKGTFTLELVMRIEGYPHVSFYPSGGGQAFGTLNFGTGKYLFRGFSGQ
jgi:RNA polymerase sigma factor (sigma-70 family)